jgi:signal transduction histidine kinase/AmiR/NasT family two-component response regulator
MSVVRPVTKPSWGSIRWRAALLTSGLVAAVLVVFIWYVVRELQHDLLRVGAERALTTARLLATQTSQTVTQGQARLQEVARDATIRAFVITPADDRRAAAIATVHRYATSGPNPGDAEVDIVAGDSRTVLLHHSTAGASTGFPPLPSPLTPGVQPLVAVGDRLYTTSVADIETPPDAAGHHSTIGYLVVLRYAKPSQQTVATTIVGNDAVFLFGNASGSVWSNLMHVVQAPGFDTSEGSATEFIAPSGQHLIGASAPIGGAPWLLVVELSRDAIVAPAFSLLRRLIVAGLAVLLVTTMVAVVLSARVMRPLGELTNAAVSIAGGDYSRRVGTSGRDEVGRLGEAFNLMAGRVDDGRRALEAQNAELSQSREAAERANQVKDQFLAVLSHELRTPLNAMLGWCHMLRDGSVPPEKTHHALEVIERNALAQLRLVEDLLDVSRIVAGKFSVDLQPIDPAMVVRAAIESIQPMAAAKRISLTSTIDAPTPKVLGDAGRLQQVVWNLLSNAIKFTPPGGRVDVSVAGAGGSVEILVRDTGEGLSSHALQSIFKRFQQESDSLVRRRAGLGLGLAIVREVVELHGGTVCAESAGPGQGSTFRVRVPAISGAEASGPRALATAPLAMAAASVRGLRILTVEDAEDARELLTDFLTEHGAVITAFDAADAALAWLDGHAADLIISDLEMPEQDGLEMIRRVRIHSCAAARRTPAIALTAYGAREDRDRSLAAGFQAHLVKPVDLNELVATISSVAVTSDSASEPIEAARPER